MPDAATSAPLPPTPVETRGPSLRLITLPSLVTLEYLVLSAGGLLCLIAFLATLAATYQVFRVAAPILWAAVLVCAAFFVWFSRRDRPTWRLDRFDLAAIAIAILVALSSTVLHHWENNAESDAGFYANDAWVIASTGGRYLSGPYDSTLPHLRPTSEGYRHEAMHGLPAFAAMFAWLGGPDAAVWANFPLLLLTLLSIFLLGRKLGATWGALFAQAFYGTSLVTVWLSRYVMTENAATTIFWLCVLAAWSFPTRIDAKRAAIVIVALAWGCLVRPEGFVVAAVFAAVVAGLRWRSIFASIRAPRAFLALFRRRSTQAVAATMGVCLLLVGAMLTSEAAPQTYLRSAVRLGLSLFEFHVVSDNPSVPDEARDVPPPPPPDPQSPEPAPEVRTWGDYALRYEWDSLKAYYIPWFMAVAFLGVLVKLVDWRRALLLCAFALPYAMFLFMPPVTPQHPWFMRRLWVAWLPLVYLLAGVSLDLRNAAWRWPVKRKRSTRPRPDGAIAVAIVGLVLLVPHLDRSFPVFAQRAQDGFATVHAGLDEDLPPDSLLIIDEDVARFSTPLRIRSAHNIVTWYDFPADAFRFSLEGADRHSAAYILRRNFTQPVPVLETDPGGSRQANEYTYVLRDIPAGGLLAYVSSPPLEQGYTPLGSYIDAIMPPPVLAASFRATLLETERPLVIQKNIRFNATEWVRTSQGMQATVENASLDFDASRFTGSFVLHLAYLQLRPGPTVVTADTPLGVTELSPSLESDGSGTLRFAAIRLPPLPSTIDFPNGTVLRGIFVGVA